MADNKSGISVDAIYNRTVGVPYSVGTIKTPIGAASVRTTVLKGNATYLLSADVNCHVNFALVNTTDATTLDHIMFGGSEWIIHTGADTTYYISVIQSDSAGYLYHTELTPDRLG